MRRRDFIQRSLATLAGTEALSAITRAKAGPAKRPPNIILIVADDLGYADLGVQGSPDIRTPHIDSIAQNGVRFTDGYVTCPVCSPSRAGLLTGRYQQRFGHEFNPGMIDQAQKQFGLPLSERTLADRLKEKGYATAAIGKWHLGSMPAYHPMRRGFDTFYGFLGGSHPYVDLAYVDFMLRGMEKEACTEYATIAFAKEANAFINQHGGTPFFLYLAFNAVHEPLEVPQPYRARFKNISNEKRHTFAGMVSAMDDAVGEILKTLKTAGQTDNTLIFFLSDNGGPTRQTSSRNDPFRGYKGQMYEGGIRVPYLMQWPARIPKGATNSMPATSLDVAATAMSAAGMSIKSEWKLDGVDLMPLVLDEAKLPTRDLLWRYGRQRAIRSSSWKLVQGPESRAWELYNLGVDDSERHDVADQHPDLVAKLDATWSAWSATLATPRWKEQDPRPEPDD